MVLSKSGRRVLIYSAFLLLVYSILSLVSLPLSLIFGGLLVVVYGILNLVCLNQAFIDVARDIFNVTSANDTWQTWFVWWFVTLVVFGFVTFTLYVKIMNERWKRKRQVTSS